MVANKIQQALGRSSPYVSVLPPPVLANRAPASSDLLPAGQLFINTSTSPNAVWTSLGNGTFSSGGNADATTTVAGIVELSTLAELQGGTAPAGAVPTSNDVATVIAGVVVGAIPAWTETVSGIGQISTNTEATGGTNDTTAMTPLKVAAALAGGLPVTGGAGSFTTLAASGLTTLSASATVNTAGTTLNLGGDASADAINVGTGAAARTITIGNVTGATAVAVNTGTGHFTVATTGAGDIILNSDDTVLIDADGVLELNSSAGNISVGNDAVAQTANFNTGAAVKVTNIGSTNTTSSTVINAGSGLITMVGGIALNSAAGPQILAGAGDPNGLVTAPKGSLWMRTDGGASTRLYSNSNSITAWAAITSA